MLSYVYSPTKLFITTYLQTKVGSTEENAENLINALRENIKASSLPHFFSRIFTDSFAKGLKALQIEESAKEIIKKSGRPRQAFKIL